MEDEEPRNKVESDEEDYESFFLQPASSPYNIAEKVQEANKMLFDETCENSTREQRVKFRETLVDFEPDLTDDDVQSIESYNEAVDYSIAENPIEELKYVIQKDNEIYDIIEEVENEIEIENEKSVEDFIDEDVKEEDSVDEIIDEDVRECDSIDDVKSISEEETIVVEGEDDEVDRNKTVRPKSARRKSPLCTSPLRRNTNFHVDCKSHCIEELESRLDICISKLHLDEKPACPPLKLHRRKCCENNNRIEQKLPLYTGLRSEYGLSASQIEKLQKRKEAIRRKEEKRLALQEEYRKRRIEQNELIFCQWLKEISDRKQRQQSPVINGKKRPKTSMAISRKEDYYPVSKGKTRQRPHTTATCVFVEIPERYLKGGIKIGDLFISNRDVSSKHIQLLMYA